MNWFMRRIEGALKPLVSDTIPKNYLFFDTETKTKFNNEGKIPFDLILGTAIFVQLDKNLSIKQRIIYKFTTVEEFIEMLVLHTRNRNVLYIFAHNVGFDIRVLNLPDMFYSLGYISPPPILNQLAFIWSVNTGKGKLLFCDTANLGIRSVSSLGKDLGYEKLTIDFETCTQEELFIYCLRDVEILEKFMLEYIKYIDTNRLGALKTTLASQAMTAYRTKFITNPPHIHNYVPALALERKSYHGGRVECFRYGKLPNEKWYYLDVNSMYPYCMMGNDLPIQFIGYSDAISIPLLKVRVSRYYVIADVTLNTDENVYPYKAKNKLLFPIGKFRTVLSDCELRYALDHGHVIKCHSSAQYKKGSIFDKYVNFFYSAKVQHTLEKNSTYRTIDKLFLNSLYGKFGQTQPTREPLGEIEYKGVLRMPMYDVDNDLRFVQTCWYGNVYKESKQGETSFSCPYLASAITAKARMLLWMYIKQANIENVAYCDTDSLIVNERGYGNLIQSISETALGSLKLETSNERFELWGAKDYVFGETIRHKGLPASAKEISNNLWQYLEFEGFITWLNRGAKGSPIGQNKTKSRRTTYNKGIIDAQGFVRPFTLDEQS